MGVYISRIEVANFRNFADLVLDPFPARAVVVGENGTGKSNLLHAIRLVLDPSLPDTARILRPEDVWEGSTAKIANGAVVSVAVELQGFDDDDEAKAVLASSTVSYNPYVARLTYRFFPKAQAVAGSARPLSSLDYDFIVFGGLDEGNDVRRIRGDISLRVLAALRDAESDLATWRRNPLRDLLERLPLDPANLERVAGTIKEAVDELREDGNIVSLEAQLKSRLSEMTGPKLPLEPTLGFASSQPDELVRSVRLFVDASRQHLIADASLGGANLLYLALLLESLDRQRKDQQLVSTILAVEEPEAHLHVSLQRRLFRHLLRDEPALLLTTHSPHIAAVAPVDSLVVLRATTSGTVGKTTAGVTLGEKERRDIERYLDVSRAEMVFANVVVLVEGIAETYLLPAIAESAGFDLDSYGVIVTSVHGADFLPYTTLLGPTGLGTPHVVITDGDASNPRRVREAGIARALRLLPASAERTELIEEVGALPDRAAPDYQEERQHVIEKLEKLSVFVGAQTLETDICGWYGDEMLLAADELPLSKPACNDIVAGIANERTAAPDAKVRASMMKRIDAMGKGRFAQRLAEHIATGDIQVVESRAAAGGYSRPDHLLNALEHVSQLVRGEAFLAPVAPVGP